MNGQPQQGMGCFAKGCLAVLIAGFFLAAVLIGGAWYFYKKTADTLTSPGPADIRIEAPSEAQYRASESAMDRLRRAIANNEETTVELTAADLNALLAREPEFSALRNKVRVEIADSEVTINMSTPLDFLPFPRLKKRWFNGTARFTLDYAHGEFRFELESVEANGHQVPGPLLYSFNSTFSESMNQSFRDELRKNREGKEFWTHVKSMSVAGDKLVVTTQVE